MEKRRIVLVGDHLARSYRAKVAALLGDGYDVWMPEGDLRNTISILESLEDSVLRRQPDLVHIGSSLSETRYVCCGSEERLVPLRHYRFNVERILGLLAERSTAQVIWATIPPVHEKSLQKSSKLKDAPLMYSNEAIVEYNEEAREVVERHRMGLNDLYGTVKAASREESLRPDGIHFGKSGLELIARKVARVVKAHFHDED